MNKPQLVKNFIKTYFELLNDIKEYSDNNEDFDAFYKKNYLLKKTNVKIFLRTWYNNVSEPYYDNIMRGDVDYLFSKEVVDDISRKTNGNVIKYMNIIKGKYNNSNNDIIKRFLSRVQQLTYISSNYFNTA